MNLPFCSQEYNWPHFWKHNNVTNILFSQFKYPYCFHSSDLWRCFVYKMQNSLLVQVMFVQDNTSPVIALTNDAICFGYVCFYPSYCSLDCHIYSCNYLLPRIIHSIYITVVLCIVMLGFALWYKFTTVCNLQHVLLTSVKSICNPSLRSSS